MESAFEKWADGQGIAKDDNRFWRYDAERAFSRKAWDAALEEAAKIARHFKDELTAEEWPPSGLCQSDGRFDGAAGDNAATWIEQKILALKEQK